MQKIDIDTTDDREDPQLSEAVNYAQAAIKDGCDFTSAVTDAAGRYGLEWSEVQMALTQRSAKRRGKTARKKKEIAAADVVISGRIIKVHKSGLAWSSGILRKYDDAGDPIDGAAGKVSFAGAVSSPNDGDEVTLYGKWEDRGQWGTQLKVARSENGSTPAQPPSLDPTPEGLTAWLAKTTGFHGVGPSRAAGIVERYGASPETWRKFLEGIPPDELSAELRVPAATIEAIRAAWYQGDLTGIVIWLHQFDLTEHQVAAVLEAFGKDAASILRSNPYALIRAVDGLGFKRVDVIALKTGFPVTDPIRLRAALVFLLDEDLKNGSTWMDRKDLLHHAGGLLHLDTEGGAQLIESALDQLIDTDHVYCEGGEYAGQRVAKYGAWKAEVAIAGRLGDAKIMAQENHFDPWTAKQTIPFALEGRQLDAWIMALSSPISVISGGAGTGKTFTLQSIVDTYQAAGKSVVMCAPTGKAARRMDDVVNAGRVKPVHASTIHRLLEYRGTGFMRRHLIEEDLVIVDEVSMVDVFLFRELLKRIDSRRTQLLLVGDHHQLPPVGPGNLLRDIIEHELCPVTILDKCHRQAGPLKTNSSAILTGKVAPTVLGPDGDPPHPWVIMDGYRSSAEVFDRVLSLLSGSLGASYDVLREVQVLCPKRDPKAALSTARFNPAIQRLMQRQLYNYEYPEDIPDPDGDTLPPRRFFVGDKVIQRKNNYEIDVMNGTLGIIEAVAYKGSPNAEIYEDARQEQDPDGKLHHLRVRFETQADDEEPLTIDADGLRDLSLGYALTIHQVQGSEFPCAIVVCHKADSYMLTRNLLYTAVTRASATVIVVGDSWAIRNAAGKDEVGKRKTWMGLENRNVDKIPF